MTSLQELKKMSPEELKQKAHETNIPVRDNMSQDELIAAIMEESNSSGKDEDESDIHQGDVSKGDTEGM